MAGALRAPYAAGDHQGSASLSAKRGRWLPKAAKTMLATTGKD